MIHSTANYAVAMDCEHATMPDVLLSVLVRADTRSPAADDEDANYKLWVPNLETWTLDTLRMILHELAAYLPAHTAATVTVLAHLNKPKGRQPKAGPRRQTFSEHVEISVSANGWTATLFTHRNGRQDKEGRCHFPTGDWSEPMQSALLDMAAQSPFPLAGVRVVDCADPSAAGIRYPSRRDVMRGRTPNADLAAEAESYKTRLKRLIDDALNGGDL